MHAQRGNEDLSMTKPMQLGEHACIPTAKIGCPGRAPHILALLLGIILPSLLSFASFSDAGVPFALPASSTGRHEYEYDQPTS